jgi:riboflavin kinase / FMN adenylyltransferase
MRHVTSLEALNLDRLSVLTIGAFDGVHRGHQALIGQMVAEAHANNRAAVVLTFFPHPSVVLRGRRPSFYLTSPDDKAAYLAQLGVDATVTHPFNLAVSEITARQFVDRLLTFARLDELWCGPDFALGHNREGTVEFLQVEGQRRGFRVRVLPPVLIDGEIISSTRIRQTLRDGAVEQAARYLGRPFKVAGQVVEGARRGRQLGIPTANLSISEEMATPAVGVYACRASGLGWQAQAVVNIGFRPTFEGDEPRPTVEAHLLDFSADLYGQTVALEFIARLRPEIKFPGIQALLAQIQKDILEARVILA